LIAITVAIILFLGATIFLRYQQETTKFQKGMGYVTWSKDGYLTDYSDKSLAALRKIGVNWVSVVVTWYQADAWSTDIHRSENTPSDESLIHVIRKAHELGMKVMLKMHLDIIDKSDGSWRGEIGFRKEDAWAEWFRGYNRYIMHYVSMAEKEKVEMVCVGTELSTTATVKELLWRELIKKTRDNYSGLLTYAAHWDRYMDIRFWDAVDYVGINAYFPLSQKMTPIPEELDSGWSKWLPEIEEFQKRVDKPIIFPEIGCRPTDGSSMCPWEHMPKEKLNLELQKDYYESVLKTFWEKEWFYGLYWWYWGTNVRMGGKHNRGFTPQNKPAEEVLKKWYHKPAVRKQFEKAADKA